MDPQQCFEAGLSDHSPLALDLATRAPLPFDARPIPKYIASSKRFGQILELLAQADGLPHPDPPQRLMQYKELIKEAGRIAMVEERSSSSLAAESRAGAFSTVSRCVMYNDTHLLSTKLAGCPIAAEHLIVQGGEVQLKDPKAFLAQQAATQRLAHDVRMATLKQEEIEASAAAKKKLRRERLAQERHVRLWAPSRSASCSRVCSLLRAKW